MDGQGGQAMHVDNGTVSEVGKVRVTKAIEQLNLAGEVVNRYVSGTEAAQSMKVSQGGISQCCTGKRQIAFGYRWRFYVGQPSDCKFINLPTLPTSLGFIVFSFMLILLTHWLRNCSL